MRNLILIGTGDSKRTVYFQKAAEELQVPLSVFRWEHLKETFGNAGLKGAAVKIDPPSFPVFDLPVMREKIKEYQQNLLALGQSGGVFLNSPESVCTVLDKRECKIRLQAQKVPVTQMLSGSVQNAEQLLESMEKERVFSVFVKPVLFSGAAGVTALRVHPYSKKMTAYTSCRMAEGKLVNTKTLYYMEDRDEIAALLDKLCSLDVIVERWYPKSQYHGKSYDLRVVYQFGHIAHIVVRQSKGPVTNLHLNNQALDIGELSLGQAVMEELEETCGNAVKAFPGLSVAGIDILLEKNSKKPYVIEINGQGDLIYQDIYSSNRIYREQVFQMAKMTGGCYEHS